MLFIQHLNEIASTDAFVQAFAELADLLLTSCSLELLWKDVNPGHWSNWPRNLQQHQGPYCLAIKADPQRLARCIAADTAEPELEGPHKRSCPFGVVDMVVPLHRGGELLGWCCVSGWRDKERGSQRDDLNKLRQQLPHWEAPHAEAIAEMVRRLVEGIIHLRPGGLRMKDERLQRCDALIEEQLDASLRGLHLAAQLHLSPSRFVHWFKETSGESISEHLQRRLMAKACHMLLRSGHSVTRVAMDLGYSSPTVFSTAFKRYHGASPGRWRKHMRLAGE